MTSHRDDGEWSLVDGDIAVTVSPLGGAIRSAEYRGTPFLVAGGGPDGRMASFPLVPFGNRVDRNAMTVATRDYTFTANTADQLYLHGDGWLGLWHADAVSPNEVTISFRHQADGHSPYDYLASQIIRVENDRMTLSISVVNKGEALMPFGLGQHPFFPLTPETRLEARAQCFWTEREGHLPGERLPLPPWLGFNEPKKLPDHWINNAFEGWDGTAVITWPELSQRAVIHADGIFGNFMIYKPAGTNAEFFCFEPMSHLPNGHHMPDFGGMALLAPGENLFGQIDINLSSF